jgi:hypothetical protein
MTANNSISTKEHKLLLSITFAAFIFSFAGSISYSIKADLKRSEYFRQQEENRAQNKLSFSGPYCSPDRHPKLLSSIILLVGATFFSLCVTKRYLLSFLFTIASLTRFTYWFVDTKRQFSDDISGFVKGIDRFFYNAGAFDLAVLLLISIIFFWQISILLRMLIKTLQRKPELP